MDIDDDYAPDSPAGSTEMDSSASSEGSHPHQSQEQAFRLPMRPVSPGSENQQAAAGPSATPAALTTTTTTTSRKRRRSSHSIPGANPAGQPLKRHRGFFTQTYVDLYNGDVEEICQRLNMNDNDNYNDATAASSSLLKANQDQDLPPSQVGAVLWTSQEKAQFFSALARAGRLDLSEISRRIRTKSVLEVQQYLMLLREELRARWASGQTDPREVGVSIADVPAAVELHQSVCAGLEVFADELTLREQQHEEKAEARRWGGAWLITPALAGFLDREVRQNARVRKYPYLSSTNISGALTGEGGLSSSLATTSNHHQQYQHQQQQAQQQKAPPFAELLHVRTWLKLSERMFMNSAVPDGSWEFYSEEPPSMRATAFQDFGALAESVTRRLVAAALHAASARIRAKLEGGERRTRPIVKAKDVRAAAEASLAGRKGEVNARGFWARSARRLRLNVYGDDEDESGSDGGDDDADDDGDDDGHGDDHDKIAVSVAAVRAASGAQEEEGFSDSHDPAEDDDEDEKAEEDSEDEPEFLSYNEVEKALGYEAENGSDGGETESDVRDDWEDEDDDVDNDDDDNYLLSSDNEEDLTATATATAATAASEQVIFKDFLPGVYVDAGPDDDDDDDDDEDEVSSSEKYKHHLSARVNQDEVDRDLHEALEWAGPAYTGALTTHARRAARRRIEKEHCREALLEAADVARSLETQEWLQEAVIDPASAAAAVATRGGGGRGSGSGDKVTHRIEADIRRWEREKAARRERLREETRRTAAAATKNGLQLQKQDQQQGLGQHWDERVEYRAEWEERQRRVGGWLDG